MRIVQIIPTIAYGDAVSNDAIALKKLISSLGYRTNIYAESIVPPLDNHTALKTSDLPVLKSNDIILYHLSTGSKLNYEVANMIGRKIVIYHNITPPHYFNGNDNFTRDINQYALEGAKYLSDKVDYCIADSEYNKEELIKLGYKCPIDVLPILIPFDDYKQEPSKKILNRYADDRTNILFTGRIAPNKKQEDIISTFYYYKKFCDPLARLFLVGSYKENDMYFKRLKKYISALKLDDVYFTGHIKFNEILAYYKLSDIFLCMSEHEGFCVPLVEAMFFEKPIVAYNSSAIPFTLKNAGILVQNKDYLEIAKLIEYVMNNVNVKEKMIEEQNTRVRDFEYKKIKEDFITLLNKFIGAT